MMQLAYRVYGFLEELKKRHGSKSVLLVTHGGVCRAIRTFFEDMTNEEYFNYSHPNCGLAIYEL